MSEHNLSPCDDVEQHREADERAVLLATKLHVPNVRGRQLISRRALLDSLTMALRRRKVTLLSAPAGWGKTTLLAQWASVAGNDRRSSWLSLDSSDNDPAWFWRYVIAALQEIDRAIGGRAVELLEVGADPMQVVLPTLLNDLEVLTGPAVLILDDYHLVTNHAVHEQMSFVITHLPAHLHLALSTRSDPPLPLARLRAQAELVEIRSADLRFGLSETDHLLNNVLGLNLADTDIEMLQRRTEGWAAGLCLAALSVAGRGDPSPPVRPFADENRHIVDYLLAEVLDRQPRHLRTFLLHTSILSRLTGPLCDTVLQATDSEAFLAQIERDNVFIVPLDMSRRWYRYHHMFADLLRVELQRTEPDLVADLHRRAAVWFQTEGLLDDAVRHLAAAGDVEATADLIATRWAAEFNAGSLTTLSHWLGLLPDDAVAGDPRLCAVQAWITLNLGRFDDALRWIEAAGTPTHHGLAAQVAALRVVYAFKKGHLTATMDTARRIIALHTEDAPQAAAATHCIYGAGLYFSGRIDEAQLAFRRAVRLAEHVGSHADRRYALGYLAMISARRGQLMQAEELIRRASGSTEELAAGGHAVDVMVSVATAIILDHRGDGPAAASAAEIAVRLSRKGAGILEVVEALTTQADILDRLGDHKAATASRAEAHVLLERCPATASPRTSTAGHTDPMFEELTPKELEVARLLATKLSRREIGERLYVSLNTVKSHQRAVYRKLGVQDRAAAITRLRDLDVL